MILRISLAVASFGVGSLAAHSTGPDPRYTGAPGDDPAACSACHSGAAPNSGPGSVNIVLPGGNRYTPGVTRHIVVQVSDPAQKRWGFQLSARLASDPANGQAGDLNPTDGNTQVLCDNGSPKPCPDATTVQFIEHTVDGTRLGTSNGVAFEFDWTPPATAAGDVLLYAAGNAANGNNQNTGDRIYTTSVRLSAVGGSVQTSGPQTRFVNHGLVGDLAGTADQRDPNLMNPWGIALSPTGPFWISNNRTGTSTLYNGTGQLFPLASPLVVKVPAGASAKGSSTPTGQVLNFSASFEIASGKPAQFIFATEDGTISGWNSAVDSANAIRMVDNSGSGAVYKGLALGVSSSGPTLYAANFNSGKIDVFDSTFAAANVAGGFNDPNLPAGFAPFNIQRFGPRLFVTYAKQDAAKQTATLGSGNGFVNVFDLDGNLKKRLVSQGVLNSPWGLAIASAFFGDFSSTLLVGNFGDGRINAFDLATGEFIGTLQDPTGAPISIEGLWALQAGNGKTGGDSNTIYFTAGISGGGAVEDHGLFGSLQVAPAN